MEQVLAVKGLAQDVVWAEAKDRVGAEWAARLQQDRAEVASVRNAEQRQPMLLDSLVMR